MKRIIYTIAAILALVGCQLPLQVTSKARRIGIIVTMDTHLPGLNQQQEENIRNFYYQQIKKRLSNVANVITDASNDPSIRPVVEVHIDDVSLSDYPTKAEIFHGWLVDSTLNFAYAALNQSITHETGPIESETPMNETLVGKYVVRGIHKHRLERLGYRPLLISGELIFRGNGMTYECNFDGWKLLPRMRPLLKDGNKDQSSQIREEEGKALAGYIMDRLDSSWQWSMSPD